MYYLHHIQPPTAAAQSVYLQNFLPTGPCLCVVKHTSLSFVALASSPSFPEAAAPSSMPAFSPLDEIFSLAINARILRIAPLSIRSEESSEPQRIAVLTDHHAPRLFVLRFDASSHEGPPSKTWARHVVTEATLPLDELGRPAAENGLTLEVEPGSHGEFAFTHTHAGIIRVARTSGSMQTDKSISRRGNRSGSSSQSRKDSISSVLNGETRDADMSAVLQTPYAEHLARAMTLRLPHPHLISATFLERTEAGTKPVVALLSLSSTTSRLPGLGMQCLPVLSFHTVNENKQELQPLPWLPSYDLQGPPSPVQQRRVSTSSRSDRQRMPGDFYGEEGDDGTATPRNNGSQRSGQYAVPPSSRYGPAAMGKSKTKEQEAAEDQRLAKSSFGRAHVPLPFSDALGAHLITALPTRAGSGVIVFSETAILYVPPPGSGHLGAMSPPQSPTTPISAAGKRRKGSNAETPTVTTQTRRGSASSSQAAQSSALSTSPTSPISMRAPPSNENGKRRRSTASSSNTPAAATTGTRRRSSAASTRSKGGLHLLRCKLPAPALTAAATVVHEPNQQDDDGVRIDADGRASIKVLFCTHAGHLELLTVELEASNVASGTTRSPFVPVALSTSSVGRVSAPAGSGALTYLGENFIHIASSSGDSMVVQVVPGEEGHENALQVAHRWPNLAPILDFVADDGAGNDPSSPGSAQARVITCSGSGPTGSLRVIRNGVGMNHILSLAERDSRSIWSFTGSASRATQTLVLTSAGETRFLLINDEGFTDTTSRYADAGYDIASQTLDASQIAQGRFALANPKGVAIFAADTAQALASWSPSSLSGSGNSIVTCAAINEAGQVLIALQDGIVALLQADASSITLIKSIVLSSEVSAISIAPQLGDNAASLAAIALWKPTCVKLFSLPDLEDVTPSALLEAQPSLVRTILLHTFSIDGRQVSGPHLFIGLTSGSLHSMRLSLPSADSISRAVGVLEKRTAVLGTQPLHLRPIKTSQGCHAVVASCNRSTVIFSTGSSLTYSSMQHHDIRDACHFCFVNSEGVLENAVAFARQDEISICKVGQIHTLDISSIDLGSDNPISIALCQGGQSAVVLTTAFLPEGRGSSPVAGGKVKILDAQTFELHDEYELEAEERPNCIRHFTRGKAQYLAVGTGYMIPDRSETLNGRINIFQILPSTRSLHLACSENVEGNVYDLEVLGDGTRLVAAINSKVCSFEVDVDDETSDDSAIVTTKMHIDQPAAQQITELCLAMTSSWSCAFTATTLRLLGADRIIVGDALRSIVLLGIDQSRAGALREIARDCDPFWTVSCDSIDEENETYIGSDIAFNLFTSRRLKWSQNARERLELTRLREMESGGAGTTTEMPDTTWSHIMQRESAYHYGDLVNIIKRGSLVSRTEAPSSRNAKGALSTNQTMDNTVEPASPRVVFGTAAGALGIVAKLNDRAGTILSQLDSRLGMADRFPPVGGITNDDWRKLRTDHRTQSATGFVDGDAIRQMYDALSNAERAALLESGNVPMNASVEEVNNLIENLGRLS